MIIWIAATIFSMNICPFVADLKGRNAIGWFFGGLILNAVGLLIVVFLKKKK